MTDEERVDAHDWHERAREVRADGATFLDLLAGIDRSDEREIVLRVVDPGSGTARTLVTRVPAADPRIASLAGLWSGASWQEREIADLLGIDFESHPDPRPLIVRDQTGEPPLLKSTPLPERLATPWPGAAEEPERKRRRPQLPPGVRPEWMERHGEPTP